MKDNIDGEDGDVQNTIVPQHPFSFSVYIDTHHVGVGIFRHSQILVKYKLYRNHSGVCRVCLLLTN